MQTLTIQNVPTDLYEALQKSAEAHKHHINHEVILWLKRALHLQQNDPETLFNDIDKLNQEIKLPPLTDSFLNEAKEWGR